MPNRMIQSSKQVATPSDTLSLRHWQRAPRTSGEFPTSLRSETFGRFLGTMTGPPLVRKLFRLKTPGLECLEPVNPLSLMFKDQLFCDVRLASSVDDRSAVSAHQAYLAASSEVLGQQLGLPKEEEEEEEETESRLMSKVVRLPYDTPTIHRVLTLLYEGWVEVEVKQKEGDDGGGREGADKSNMAADKFRQALDQLKICFAELDEMRRETMESRTRKQQRRMSFYRRWNGKSAALNTSEPCKTRIAPKLLDEPLDLSMTSEISKKPQRRSTRKPLRAPLTPFKSPRAPLTNGEAPRAPLTNGEAPRAPLTNGEAPRASVTAGKSPKGSVTFGKSPKDPVTPEKSPKDSVTTGKSPKDSVTHDKSPKDSVTSGKLPKDSVTPGKSPRVPLTSRKSPKDSVTPGKSPKDSVAPGKSPKDSVAPGKSPKDSVTPGKSPKDSVTLGKSPKAPFTNGEAPRAPSTPGMFPRDSVTPRKSPRFLPQFDYPIDPEKCLERNIFDSHCHLNRVFTSVKIRELEKSNPLRGVLQILKKKYASEFGSKFEGCINVCCEPHNWKRGLGDSLCREPGVWSAYGCHPNHVADYDVKAEVLLVKYLKDPKVVALGEIGLDMFRNRSEEEKFLQEKVFRRQLRLAIETKKPLCLHVRDSTVEARVIMEDTELALPRDWPIHMHCFTDNWPTCQKWMEVWPNMKFGFTPDYYYREVVKNIPLDKLLLETDAPYFRPKRLPPAPRKNAGHPGHVFHVAGQVAALKRLDVNEVLRANRANVRAIYGI